MLEFMIAFLVYSILCVVVVGIQQFLHPIAANILVTVFFYTMVYVLTYYNAKWADKAIKKQARENR